ncbi:MAG TPA: DUF3224 domain-containing protein [Bacteroidota bacterium]
MNATATFTPAKWDEKPYEQVSPTMKMTKASVEFGFKGQMEGSAATEYVMFYKDYDDRDMHKSTAVYVGLTRFKGTLNGKKGSFATEDRGTFECGLAVTISTVIPGSGTEELKGISGKAKSESTHTGSKFQLEYSL